MRMYTSSIPFQVTSRMLTFSVNKISRADSHSTTFKDTTVVKARVITKMKDQVPQPGLVVPVTSFCFLVATKE